MRTWLAYFPISVMTPPSLVFPATERLTREPLRLGVPTYVALGGSIAMNDAAAAAPVARRTLRNSTVPIWPDSVHSMPMKVSNELDGELSLFMSDHPWNRAAVGQLLSLSALFVLDRPKEHGTELLSERVIDVGGCTIAFGEDVNHLRRAPTARLTRPSPDAVPGPRMAL